MTRDSCSKYLSRLPPCRPNHLGKIKRSRNAWDGQAISMSVTRCLIRTIFVLLSLYSLCPRIAEYFFHLWFYVLLLASILRLFLRSCWVCALNIKGRFLSYTVLTLENVTPRHSAFEQLSYHAPQLKNRSSRWFRGTSVILLVSVFEGTNGSRRRLSDFLKSVPRLPPCTSLSANFCACFRVQFRRSLPGARVLLEWYYIVRLLVIHSITFRCRFDDFRYRLRFHFLVYVGL